MKASVDTTILKLMNCVQEAFLVREIRAIGEIQLVGNVTMVGVGASIVCVSHMRRQILTEWNVHHQWDDGCLESLEFRDSRHGVLKRKRQEKGMKGKQKENDVEVLVM